MKHLILITLLISSLFSARLNWLHDYDSALILAKMQDKNVYLFIGADDCRYCDKFVKETLSKEEVIKRLKEDYILLYMSRDQHLIPDQFERYGVPRQYFLNHEGDIFYQTTGSREPDGFYQLLDEADLATE
jgi:hypothetical protein